MGLAQVLLQVCAHEYAELNGKPITERMQSVIYHAMRWYSRASLAFMVTAIPLGMAYFITFKGDGAADVEWTFPWILACLGQACALFLVPLPVFKEASGSVAKVAAWRFLGEIFGSLALFVGLYFGLKLYALPLMILARALVVVIFAWYELGFVKSIMSAAKRLPPKNDLWVKEVVPFQRRIAVSWLAGYLLFSSLPMIIFATLGPEASGRFGMTWTALFGIVSLSMALVSVRIQSFCVLIARNELIALQKLFCSVATKSFALALFGVLALLLALVLGHSYGHELSERFLSVRDVGFLGVVVLINQVIFAQAALIRATKFEPYLLNSVVSGVAQFLLATVGTLFWGMSGLVFLMLIWTLMVCLPWALKIFNAHKPWVSLV